MARLRKIAPEALIFLATFTVYLYTLCPTVYWDDAGELIAACYTIGVPHPPGHPLYAIIGKLFTLLPFGSPAYRVNLMSAFFGALTCAVLYRVIYELVKEEEKLARFARFSAAIAALCAGFSLAVWDQSIVAETTTLHCFFMMMVTLLVFRIVRSDPSDPGLTRLLLIFSFVYGLSFTNHVAGLFFAPSIGLLLLCSLRLRLIRPGRLAAMGLLFGLGLSVYAYLPIASRFDPAVDWGNPETLENFLWVVTAQQYRSDLVIAPSLFGVTKALQNLAGTFVGNISLAGCVFAVLGAGALWKAHKSIVIYGVLVLLILFSVTLNSAFISVYLAPGILMVLIWAGYGAAVAGRAAERLGSSLSGIKGKSMRWSAHAVCIALVAFLLLSHFSENNKRNYTYPKDYGMDLLSSLPEDAVLITGTADPLFIGWYLQYCENYRPDVKIITRNALGRPGYLDQIGRQYTRLNIPTEFQYETDEGIHPSHLNQRGGQLSWYVNSYFKELYELNASEFPIYWEGLETNQLHIEMFVPHKFVFRILPPSEDIAGEFLLIPPAEEILKQIDNDRPSGKVYANHVFNYGLYYHWHNDIPKMEYYYREALKLYPDEPRVLNNMGALLMERGNEDQAYEYFLAALRLRPYDPASNHNVGQILLDRGKFREAIPYFRRAASSTPSNFEDFYCLGICHSSIGKNAEAVEWLKKACNLRPNSPEALSALGIVFLRMRETENAGKLLNLAIELEPENALNWYNMACLNAVQGNESASSDNLRKALSLDYDNVYALASQDPVINPILEALLNN